MVRDGLLLLFALAIPSFVSAQENDWLFSKSVPVEAREQLLPLYEKRAARLRELDYLKWKAAEETAQGFFRAGTRVVRAVNSSPTKAIVEEAAARAGQPGARYRGTNAALSAQRGVNGSMLPSVSLAADKVLEVHDLERQIGLIRQHYRIETIGPATPRPAELSRAEISRIMSDAARLAAEPVGTPPWDVQRVAPATASQEAWKSSSSRAESPTAGASGKPEAKSAPSGGFGSQFKPPSEGSSEYAAWKANEAEVAAKTLRRPEAPSMGSLSFGDIRARPLGDQNPRKADSAQSMDVAQTAAAATPYSQPVWAMELLGNDKGRVFNVEPPRRATTYFYQPVRRDYAMPLQIARPVQMFQRPVPMQMVQRPVPVQMVQRPVPLQIEQPKKSSTAKVLGWVGAAALGAAVIYGVTKGATVPANELCLNPAAQTAMQRNLQLARTASSTAAADQARANMHPNGSYIPFYVPCPK
jgi:hypothetical protein